MRLGDICSKIGSGATPRGGKEAYSTSGIPIIRSQNVLDWSFSSNGLAYLNDEQAKTLSNVEVHQGDILLNITGDSVARACIVPSDVIPARVNQHVAILRPKEKANATFILAWLQTNKDLLLKLASSGATRNALTKRMLEGLDINLPSIDIQNHIAELISLIQSKINLNIKLNGYLLEYLKTYAKTLYCEYENDKNAILPRNWRWAEIAEIAGMVCRGIAPKYSDVSDEVVLGQTCVRSNLILVENGRTHAPRKKTEKWLKKYDLLINSTGVGSLGRTAQVWFEPKKLVADSHITIVRTADPRYALYLGFWAFKHEKHIESLHTGSTGQTELPRDYVKTMRLVLPDDKTLNRFNKIAVPMVELIVANQRENKRLEEIRDRLLPKLMSGEIDVSKIDLMQLNSHLAEY
ncbi:restriction endonuclease S subunit [Bifidobacterium adolescentis]|uniref:Restriction endonuclease S subunit n=1 Tax=Bifidobacterium adolescentis TaxID=1680 RepID=A0A1X2YVM2_BIFAD|nr:restriction endonuclease subunit S [Bifidobacterium adolescentis]OSG86208.1 restriction endonuclease S subunit [Bifidobacterium adolescentis]